MEEQIENKNTFDLIAIWNKVWGSRKKFYITWAITFVLSSALILCVPRTYTSSVVLAPESQSEMANGSLGSLASSFGINIGGIAGEDAIYPMLYPDVVNSADFLIEFEDMEFMNEDGEICRYGDHLTIDTKIPFWGYPGRWLSLFINDLRKPSTPPDDSGVVAPKSKTWWMSKMQWKFIKAMSKNVSCSLDKKTNVITITVVDQDKLICATVADSLQHRLQDFMTIYRTQKTQQNIDYYENLIVLAREDYDNACQRYIDYADGHSSTNLKKYDIEMDNLRNEMNMKESIYNTLQKQLLTSKAKLQENTPVFTTIQGAFVPERPSSPRRVRFVIMMLFLASCVLGCYVCWDELKSLI